MGISKTGQLKEIFNSDDTKYGGTGMKNGTLKIGKTAWHGYDKSVEINIPPLGIVVFK